MNNTINKKQYNLMLSIKQNPFVKITDRKLFVSVRDMGFAKLEHLPNGDKYELTEKGETALEEYELSIRAEQREEETLKIAKQAKTISIWAIVVPSILSIAALIVSIIALVKDCS